MPGEALVTNPVQADADAEGVGDGLPEGAFFLVTTNVPVMVVGWTSQRKKYVPGSSADT